MTRSLTSAERALHALRELILGGELTPGSRLGEVELADRLGVSRTPVREALSRLAAEGIVEIQPNRGARVATWTVAELEARETRTKRSGSRRVSRFVSVSRNRCAFAQTRTST